MNIAIYFQFSSDAGDEDFRKFIVETSFLIIQQQTEHGFIIITDKRSSEKIPVLSNIEKLIIKPIPNNALLKRIWLDVKLPALLKKVKADLFLSFHNFCSSTNSIPQAILIQDLEKTKKAHIDKAQLLLVTNNLIKQTLIEEYNIAQEKITAIYPSANKLYESINEEKKTSIKNKYSDDKEFFLFNNTFRKQEDFITLLKSFSYFKKRQQSNFKLLLITPVNSFFEKNLSAYKYRNDVKSIETNDIQQKALITASAYAVVLPFNNKKNIITALNTMRTGVPVITVKNSVINEVAENATLCAETEAAKDVGEKMIQVYTDENYRFRLIEKGKGIAATYTSEKAAEMLWQSILKVLE